MSRKKTPLAKRIFASLGAAAIGMVGLAGTALADPGPDQPDHPTSGTLTIHKRVGAETTSGTGNSIDNPAGTPLDGVTFTLWRVGVLEDETCRPLDLTNTADWASVPTGANNEAPGKDPNAALCKVTPAGDSIVTGAAGVEGQAKFEGLALGLYYVEETATPSNVVRKSDPFYVTVPYPNVTEGEDGEDTVDRDWNYNVHVYPKNRVVDAPKKNITERPDNLVVGSNVTWTIMSQIPELPEGQTFQDVFVFDPLDPRLEYVSSKVEVYPGVTIPSEGPWTPTGEPVTVFPTDPAGKLIDFDGAKPHDVPGLTWTFTEDGRAILDGKPKGVIVTTITTRVVSVGNGDIRNAPYGKEYGVSYDGATKPGCCHPTTVWGELVINKTDNSTPAKALKGAEFQVFEKTGETCPVAAPTTGVVATGTSDAGGVVQWAGVTPTSPLGLWVANIQTTGDPKDQSKDYCVYETKVPAGYTAAEFNHTVTIKAGADNTVTLNVVNPQKAGPNLPLTGANGTMLMMVGGLALMGIAGGTYMVTRRKAANTK